MNEFTNHKARQRLGILQVLHLETLEFSGMHPEATLADFEHHLRGRVEDLDAELEANEQATKAAVTAKSLSGPLVDTERQRVFCEDQGSGPPCGAAEKDAWWNRKRDVLAEIKAQGLREALDWECRSCGAAAGVACHTAGGRMRFPRDAGMSDGWSDGSRERSPDDARTEEVPVGVA
ncbi:hypothetical protein [Streptomyces sp. NBC_01205]|uniref:hypothetical protein n=1 Tax=Streptomyces sp. NBC_01205 TaxID=2903771 RepID=UPI002E0E6360|nr:hypothetical protein OG573_14110 [Streptomyces sp. NBC_01205]